jgi:hypothetical protein
MRSISPPLAPRGNVNIFDSMRPLYSCMGIPRFRLLSRVTSGLLSAVFMCALSLPCHADDAASGLPDAPQPNPDRANEKPAVPTAGRGRDNIVFGVHVGPTYPPEAGKWDIIINPGERPQPLTARDKLLYAAHEDIQPYTLAPALVSASISYVRGSDPKYGTDLGGFGERFGAGMLRGATDRLTGDGLLAALFHQDPRFYREGEGNGTIVHRGLSAARQAIVRRNDDGQERINASGILGHAVANFVALAYYPSVSQHASVAAKGFGIAVSADAGSRLIQEFGPDLLRLAFRRNQ